MSEIDDRVATFREMSELNDSAAKRFFDVLTRTTAVGILLQLARATHSFWIAVLASVAGVALISWIGAWILLRGFEVLAIRGFPHRSIRFSDALSFAVQIILIAFAFWGALTLAPELMKILATASPTK